MSPTSIVTKGQDVLAASIEPLLRKYVDEYERDNPKSKATIDKASKYLPGGTTRATLAHDPFPLVIKSGNGPYLTSMDDTVYLDFVSEFFAGMYGHSHPTILAAIKQTANFGFGFGAPNPYEPELAQLLVDRLPSLDQVRFCNSATEANINAIAAAIAYTGKKKVCVFENGYHGGCLSFGSFNAANALNLPHDFVFGYYNDIERSRAKIQNRDDIALILVEPMQGAGGLNPATRNFLQYLRDEATRIGAVLIFDETITSRLFYGGLHDYHGIIPDMTTMGKHFGGGFSFGAFGGRRDIMNQFNPNSPKHLYHSGTFNNNVFSMAVGIAGTKLLTRDTLEKVNVLGDGLRDRLQTIINESNIPDLQVTGFGSVIGFTWTGFQPDKCREAMYFFLLSKGIYIGNRGFIASNLTHKPDHIDRLVDAVQEFLVIFCESVPAAA